MAKTGRSVGHCPVHSLSHCRAPGLEQEQHIRTSDRDRVHRRAGRGRRVGWADSRPLVLENAHKKGDGLALLGGFFLESAIEAFAQSLRQVKGAIIAHKPYDIEGSIVNRSAVRAMGEV